ncbi:MAG: 6-carboxytetrahydropterin synthase QueD [candidate division WOR-3 bacterium]
MWTIRVSRTFSAAHYLKGTKGRCEQVHGHNYRVEVAISSKRLRRPGMVADFVEVRSRLESILPDHKLLNDEFRFNPTAENLARYFFEAMSRFYQVTRVTVWENDDCCAEFSAD